MVGEHVVCIGRLGYYVIKEVCSSAGDICGNTADPVLIMWCGHHDDMNIVLNVAEVLIYSTSMKDM